MKKRLSALVNFLFKKHRRRTVVGLAILLVFYWKALPDPVFNDPTSFVLEDKNGELLGAKIAKDGQWRFPEMDSVPIKFEKALLTFEDHRFYYHLGIDPIGIGRAVIQNIQRQSIVSGASTITMQVIRLSRKGKSRSLWEKFIEAILATRLEIGYKKSSILKLYTSHAPFGGNVVGLDAAAWRYFGKSPNLLSWGEAATLAVLPNAPALIHPGRNRTALFNKRNRLLDRLLANNTIDSLTWELAREEPLPEKPLPLPQLAPHLLDRAFADKARLNKKKKTVTEDNPLVVLKGKKTRVKTTLEKDLQQRVTQVLERHHYQLAANGIHNIAALVIEVETGRTVAYVGNVMNQAEEGNYGQAVDVITAPRSTGSVIKPFLYSMMVNEGALLPTMLVPDVPTQMQNYRPLNYLESYDGAVPAKTALARSLNVPIIRLLQRYGLEKFHYNLRQLGLTTITKPAAHYGLPLVLGGAEGNLWEITGVYASMARTLLHFYPNNGKYDPLDFQMPFYTEGYKLPKSQEKNLIETPSKLSAGAIYTTFEAMLKVERPRQDGAWELYENRKKVAWKTGTSFGFRDAWAVGVTPRYAVGVWVGNADGEGRPGLIGVMAAAPILFDIFDMLNTGRWFDPPYDELTKIAICPQSGYRAKDICGTPDTVLAPTTSLKSSICPYHERIYLDQTGQFRVHSDCASTAEMKATAWFILPPVEEYYYKAHQPSYEVLPPFRDNCQNLEQPKTPMQMIYPNQNKMKIYVPIELDGKVGKTIFKVAHRTPKTTLFWHLDNVYLGATETFHEFELRPEPGKHRLTIVDEQGNTLFQTFEILSKEN